MSCRIFTAFDVLDFGVDLMEEQAVKDDMAAIENRRRKEAVMV